MNYQSFSPRLAVIAVLISLLANTAQAQTNPEHATATISGRVTLGGNPARGIKVSLVPGPLQQPSNTWTPECAHR